ncbi:hypothetical protein [Sphingorhabdus sp.]|jgi:hypothetical protein|uniref:hypothetical protein n=1 Tax=Sphingorhabdus sp. TaxID=1902408 RepID=UPI0037CC8B87
MMVQLVWHIENAIFQFSEAQDRENWISSAKPIWFEFSPEQSDDNAKSIMNLALPQHFDLTAQNSKLVIDLSEHEVCVTAWVTLNAELRDDIVKENFIEWAEDKGGWACATIMLSDADAYIAEDSGGEFRWQE